MNIEYLNNKLMIIQLNYSVSITVHICLIYSEGVFLKDRQTLLIENKNSHGAKSFLYVGCKCYPYPFFFKCILRINIHQNIMV